MQTYSLPHILFILTSTIAYVEAGSATRGRIPSSGFGTPGVDASYDYVVIGGGTAGITLASRLAENSNASVAIVEAGGFYEVDNGNFSVVPGLALSAPFLGTAVPFQQQPLVDWGLVSTAQAGAGGRQIHYAQGKTLGGSSALNSMAFHRATNGTYQRWADIVGDESYTFANLLPYFKKSVQLTPPNLAKRNTPNATTVYDPSVFSKFGGPLQVSWGNWVDPPFTWFQKAFKAIGLPISPVNFNSGILFGYAAWIPSTISPIDATRSSSQSSFLAQSIEYPNLVVYTQARANRVFFNGTVATGVSVATQGVNFTISAKKEVILSAGVFHTPQLLMLSGIGPNATLSEYEIPIISDLSGVGQNLWDQIIFPVAHAMDVPTGAELITEPQYSQNTLQQYLNHATGPLSSENGFIAFEKIPQTLRSNFTSAALSDLASFPSDWPEVENVSNSGVGVGYILATLTASLSRGNVTIASADASVPPVVNLGWLSDPNDTDAQVAVAAVKRIRQAWSSISAITIGSELVPGPNITTDAAILAYIRESTSTIYHAAATCSMGKLGAPGAVVDSEARVFGVQGLRVVDNSVIPFAVPGHPQSTVYMLAEKIADIILHGK
ncbi:putative gmc oxidoreductase protein [Botrytis cinerea BcDW1]|uniref:Putative gmc oxidoreductase protein n=1 Tax=Botryotinia fuckeliana (strain BcDW1) TaxID=1290391 RepID=M7UAY4_BOTF1|nr:putative gmc oxidoreductase protein [Botrytis cinerea BcDW1]